MHQWCCQLAGAFLLMLERALIIVFIAPTSSFIFAESIPKSLDPSNAPSAITAIPLERLLAPADKLAIRLSTWLIVSNLLLAV